MIRARVKITFIWASLLLLAISLLAACAPAAAFTPEQAALDALHRESGVDANSLRVQQSLPVGEKVFVLVSYQTTGSQGQVEICETVQIVERASAGWGTTGATGVCRLGSTQPSPIEIGGGSISGTAGGDLSFLSGSVHDSRIVSVEVVWDDGTVDSVGVVNRSYLVARPGQHNHQEVRGLNSSGEAIYSSLPGAAPAE